MKTNSAPYSDQPPGATPDNTRVGNFFQDDGVANDYDGGYAVTGSMGRSNSQNYLTNVGAYSLSPSFYGTFDQGGNVWEWDETAVSISSRGIRGGSWSNGANAMQAAGYTSFDLGNGPASETDSFGFRIATIVPEPSTLLLTFTAFAALPTRLRKSVPHNRV
jgi:formylglycine-generating enzyme